MTPPTNVPTAKAEPLQRWSAADYAKNARFVSDLGASVFALLGAKPGMRILDLGCGDGVLTADIAAAGADVLGIDSSADMLQVAQAKGLQVRQMSGEELDFDAEFDAVFSNAALHWMLDPVAVIAGVARALKPGGRFVGEFGGHGNVAAITTAMRAVAAQNGLDGQFATPWFFPTPDAYAALLQQGGFAVESIELIPRPTPLPGDVTAWLSTFGRFFYGSLAEPARQAAIAETARLLAPSLRDQKGAWTADYVRLRFAATRIE
jgi:trans-aconitate methyltransferase